MNIASSKILYDKDDELVIDEPRILKGVMRLAKEWGSHDISEPNAPDVTMFDEKLLEFADKIADLRAKYEVKGDLQNAVASESLQIRLYDELNPLLDVYRAQLFGLLMDYISDNESIDLMLDFMRRIV